MDTKLRQALALLWRRVLRRDRAELVGGEASLLLDRNWGDRLAQPGFVGHLYEPKGLVFVSMYPDRGGGSDGGLSSPDLEHYEALERLRDCEEDDAGCRFSELMEVLQRIMLSWRICQNFVQPVLSKASIDFSRVACLTLLKWRIGTPDAKGLNKLYDQSWRDHTQEQFELLNPGVVVALGKSAEKAFQRLCPNHEHLFAIPMVIGTNIGEPGIAKIDEIGQWLQQRGE
jgi:hypothetical protein